LYQTFSVNVFQPALHYNTTILKIWNGRYIYLWHDRCLVKQVTILVNSDAVVSIIAVHITDEKANRRRVINQRMGQNSTKSDTTLAFSNKNQT